MTISRRNLMAGVTASGLTVALASDASPSPAFEDDPILPIYREWWALHIEWNRLSYLPGNEEWDFPESLDAQARGHEALKKMLQMTPSSLEGIAALAHVMWVEEGPSLVPTHPEYADQCAQREYMTILQIWRAASGQTGLPPHHSDVI